MKNPPESGSLLITYSLCDLMYSSASFIKLAMISTMTAPIGNAAMIETVSHKKLSWIMPSVTIPARAAEVY